MSENNFIEYLIDFIDAEAVKFQGEEKENKLYREFIEGIEQSLLNSINQLETHLDSTFEWRKKLLQQKTNCDSSSVKSTHQQGNSNSIPIRDALKDKEIIIGVFREFLSENYTLPPRHEILMYHIHLWCAWLFFRILKNFNRPPLAMILRMAYVAFQINEWVMIMLGIFPEVHKTVEQNYKSHKQGKEKAKEAAKATWQYLNSKSQGWFEGRTLSNISDLVGKKLTEKGIKKSKRQIQRYIQRGLESDQLVNMPKI